MKNSLIFLINIFLVVSCVDIKSEPKRTDMATAIDDTWGMRWMENKPCSAPCWEGITPGITLPEDAVSIIKKNDTVNLISVSRKSIAVEWTTENYGTISGQIHIDLETLPNVVDTIELNFSKPIKLEQLVEILGKPKIGLMGRCSPVATYFFVIDFYNSGVVYSFPEAMTPYRVSPDIEFQNISFKDPEYWENTLDQGIFQDWKGFSPEYKLLHLKGKHTVFDDKACLPLTTP